MYKTESVMNMNRRFFALFLKLMWNMVLWMVI